MCNAKLQLLSFSFVFIIENVIELSLIEFTWKCLVNVMVQKFIYN